MHKTIGVYLGRLPHIPGAWLPGTCSCPHGNHDSRWRQLLASIPAPLPQAMSGVSSTPSDPNKTYSTPIRPVPPGAPHPPHVSGLQQAPPPFLPPACNSYASRPLPPHQPQVPPRAPACPCLPHQPHSCPRAPACRPACLPHHLTPHTWGATGRPAYSADTSHTAAAVFSSYTWRPGLASLVRPMAASPSSLKRRVAGGCGGGGGRRCV